MSARVRGPTEVGAVPDVGQVLPHRRDDPRGVGGLKRAASTISHPPQPALP